MKIMKLPTFRAWAEICSQRIPGFWRLMQIDLAYMAFRFIVLALALPLLGGDIPVRHIRATGMVRAVHSYLVQVPRLGGQGGNVTLARLIKNGALVHEGDVLAEFDQTSEQKLLLEAQAKYDDLKHQVEQKIAEHKNNQAKRESDLKSAQADLSKAELEIRKGPILSEIDQKKNEIKLGDAREHVASLTRSNRFHDAAEEAEFHILELQRNRQSVSVERQKNNLDKLLLRAPIAGMVALSNTWRNQTMGHAQEGDQLWGGSPLLQLFDPSAMEVELSVSEPDGAVLVPGARATVHLDAFPDATFTAHFDSASPVATAPLGSSIKTFLSRFRLDQSDPRLMPDLSAALDIEAAK
jgi:multidrug efflux pump subunit AcrA (membrane-fusion protein)